MRTLGEEERLARHGGGATVAGDELDGVAMPMSFQRLGSPRAQACAQVGAEESAELGGEMKMRMGKGGGDAEVRSSTGSRSRRGSAPAERKTHVARGV